MTEETKPAKRLSYTHDAMVDLILAEPTVTPEELGQVFGLSKGWVSRVISSDSFQARLAERKAQIVDPLIARSLNERLRGVTVRAIDVVAEKLSTEDASASFALDALAIATGGMTKARQ